MKPRTKLQKAVVKSSESLPPLTKYQRQQAIKRASIHIAKLDSKGNYVCLECGHKWHGEKQEHIVCPECGVKLDVDTTRKRNFEDKDYFAVTRKCNGFQVVRVFFIHTWLKRGEKAERWVAEAFQRWILPNGESLIVARRRHWMSYYCDSWDWSSGLELRTEHEAHSISPYCIVGKTNVIPELSRNGFDGNFHQCGAASLFKYLLSDNRIETLWKVGQYELVKYFLQTKMCNLNSWWPTIKVVIRHHYHIDDATLWCDLLKFLIELGKDIHNPKLICPANLQEAHDEWQRRVEAKREREAERRARERELEEERRYISDIKRVMQDQRRYKREKSKFFDLELTDKELSVKPLVSVHEFLEEAKVHHHCVYTCKYFNKKTSLILHALIGGTSVATIEFNLENMEILQCRGKFNSKPEQYDRIVSLINKNKNQIAKRITA